MPTPPQVGYADAETVAGIYRDAELAILAKIVRALAQGIDTPGGSWAVQQLARLQDLREEALRELTKVNPTAAAEIAAALSGAYSVGGASALADLGAHIDAAAVASGVKRAAVTAFAAEVTTGLAAAQSAIIRTTEDVVREVISRTVASTIAGATTRREAAQAAITELLGRGLTGIDSGRGRMGLSDYAAMAVRTATTRAAIQGHTSTMLANGMNLVVIHPGPRACDICDRWARKVLALDSTPAGRVKVQSVLGGEITVTVDGSLSEALAAGYQHPNCRCGMAAYLPGVTRREIIKREPWDADAYAAQQRQREIERQIRDWKLEAATSLDDDRRAAAEARVKGWQAQMREHIKANPYLKRQSAREQIDGPARA